MLRVAIYQDNAPWSWEEGGQIRGSMLIWAGPWPQPWA
jgi:hypothetical protein